MNQREKKLKEALCSSVIGMNVDNYCILSVISIDIQYHNPEEKDGSYMDKWESVTALLSLRAQRDNMYKSIYAEGTFFISYDYGDDKFIVNKIYISKRG